MDTRLVVICAAGCGSRLGANRPKSLVEVGGKSILEWQLMHIVPENVRVKVVVGFQGESVARMARRFRPSVTVVINDEWKSTKTGCSLSLGIAGETDRCVSLDGDLLVRPVDFQSILSKDVDTVGVGDVNSEQPVYAVLDAFQCCRQLTYSEPTLYEWTGLVNFNPQFMRPHRGNVFEMIESLLPCASMPVQCVEVDTPRDLANAMVEWNQINRPEGRIERYNRAG